MKYPPVIIPITMEATKRIIIIKDRSILGDKFTSVRVGTKEVNLIVGQEIEFPLSIAEMLIKVGIGRVKEKTIEVKPVEIVEIKPVQIIEKKNDIKAETRETKVEIPTEIKTENEPKKRGRKKW